MITLLIIYYVLSVPGFLSCFYVHGIKQGYKDLPNAVLSVVVKLTLTSTSEEVGFRRDTVSKAGPSDSSRETLSSANPTCASLGN